MKHSNAYKYASEDTVYNIERRGSIDSYIYTYPDEIPESRVEDGENLYHICKLFFY